MSPLLKDQSGPEAFTWQSWQTQPSRLLAAKRRFAKPEVLRKHRKSGEVRDIDGILWDVRDVRSTKHGFNLCYGTPTYVHPAYSVGLPRLIATRELWEFWDTNCTQSHGFLFDLPAGRTTLKRLRQRLGFNFHEDTDSFFVDRIADLASLSARQFATKHNVKRDLAYARRQRFFGNRARPIGWWRNPKLLAVLLSGQTLVKIARKLGISTSHSSRLRKRAKQEFV